jgi:hypothetical protein
MKRFTPYSAAYPKGHVLQRNDDPAMVEAIVWLSRQRIAFARVSPYQLKIGPSLSFYPVKGTLRYDGEPALPVRGLSALQALLKPQVEAPASNAACERAATAIQTPRPHGIIAIPLALQGRPPTSEDVNPPWNEN